MFASERENEAAWASGVVCSWSYCTKIFNKGDPLAPLLCALLLELSFEPLFVANGHELGPERGLVSSGLERGRAAGQ